MHHRIAWMSAILVVSCTEPLPGVEESGSSTTTTTTSTSSSEDGASVTTMDPEVTTIGLDTTASEVSTDETTTTTTGPDVDCTEPTGELSASCPATQPFCVDGFCAGCTNPVTQGCAEAMAPGGNVCDASGACVVCNEDDATACSGATPACDLMTNECVICTEHPQCGSSACNLFDGSCVEGMVVTVGVGQMYASLNAAVTAVTAGGGGTIVVYPGTYNEAVSITGQDTVVAFLAGPGVPPEWNRNTGAGAPQLRANDSATVLVDGINFRINNSLSEPALRVDDSARLWVDRSTIAQNTGVAMRAEVSAEAVLRNCFVAGANNLAALRVETGSNATVQYSTVVAAFGLSRALSCDASSATVSDSILLTQGTTDEVDCSMITAEGTASTMMLAGSNVQVGPIDSAWFTNVATGDFHLVGAGPGVFADIAEWNDGDPSVDIDGEARSGVDGTPEHAGADFVP